MKKTKLCPKCSGGGLVCKKCRQPTDFCACPQPDTTPCEKCGGSGDVEDRQLEFEFK